MSSRHDRVLAALNLEEPDRVPTFDLMNEYAVSNDILGKRPHPIGLLLRNEHTSRLMDHLLRLPVSPYFLDMEMERFANLGAEAAVKMGYDSAWISYFPVMRFRDSKTIVDIFGRVDDVVIDERGNLANPVYREGLITDDQAWKAWDKRDLLRLPDKVNRAFSNVNKRYGGEFFIFGFCGYGLFENVWQSIGFERFAVALRKDPGFIEGMVSFYTDLFCMNIEGMADAGLPGVVYTDDLAFRSGPMLNPRKIEELFGDSYRRFTETAHSLGMKIIIHSCGNATTLLNFFADCGFDGVHPIEPTAGMTLAESKKLVGDRMCIIGNIDITYILVEGSREEVFEAVRQAIDDAGKGGGYILGPDHSHPTISAERLRWMVEAAQKYGRYKRGSGLKY